MTLNSLAIKLRNRSIRVLNACAVLVVALSNILPYRLCQSFRQSLLQLAGVRFKGRCVIRGPFYVQYPSRLTVGAGCRINGHIHFENAAPIVIGDDCAIGPGAMFFTMNHGGAFPRSNEPSGIVIGDRVLFGGAVRVLPGVSVGADAVVGAGSVLLRDVGPGETVFGNPARPLPRVPPPAAKGD